MSARSVREALETSLKGNANALAKVATVFGFVAAATAGQPLGMAAGIALILNTAASAISAAIAVGNAFFAKTDHAEDEAPYYERFRVLYYISCVRCYTEALKHTLDGFEVPGDDGGKKPKLEKDEIAKLKEELAASCIELEETELGFLFCVDPSAGPLPLFEVFGKWTASTLHFYGVDDSSAVRKLVDACVAEAGVRLRVLIAQDEPEAAWMRQYLALEEGDASDRVVCTLEDIRDTLAGWLSTVVPPTDRFAGYWAHYRDDLRALPDQKETMYNEQFGVRKVFLQPEAQYHVAGAPGEAGTPNPIRKLAVLLGALVSERTSEEDLIVLCGGPGCGKSTLCRMLASELAENPDVFPVFLRLRRLKEGADIARFIEDSLRKLGVVDRLSDLRDLSSLVIILDGFDELVMASRSRLRRFFAALLDEHSMGPLRGAKFIVSGRDTLFPGGEGLPTGTHVLTLQPFDRQRVTAWGEKWRAQHTTGPGGTFHPERLLASKKNGQKPPPLHHLVSWPLTLHLVAQVHTSGHLDTAVEDKGQLEKAYLYRSILAETAARQTRQAEGEGRLDPEQMRKFLRALAWEMYRRSTDSMDPVEVMPIITQFWPGKQEADMSELAEVAVVNCPELTRGEQTGFEFVHKSFSEYLVAEHIAHFVERAVFQTPDYGETEPTWRMGLDEAGTKFAGVLGIRLLTEEVQEMLEPMLGCLDQFLAGERLAEVVGSREREGGLLRIIQRIEELLKELLLGKSFEAISRETQDQVRIKNPLEACANQCAGYLLVGSAAARQLRKDEERTEDRPLNCEPYGGAFWQCLCLLVAGGIRLDTTFAARTFDGLSVARTEDERPASPSDLDCPIPLGLASSIHGMQPDLENSARATIQELVLWMAAESLVSLTRQQRVEEVRIATLFERDSFYWRIPGMPLLEDMVRANLLPPRLFEEYQELVEYAIDIQRKASGDMMSAEDAAELFELVYHKLRSAGGARLASRGSRWVHEIRHMFYRRQTSAPAGRPRRK